jgi:ABC-type Fe3+ transport system substrate-binding protein
MEGSPHPNAARVFAHWLLTRSTQELWARLIRENSRRTDVAPGDPTVFPDPARLQQYFKSDEANDALRVRATDLAKAVIK